MSRLSLPRQALLLPVTTIAMVVTLLLVTPDAPAVAQSPPVPLSIPRVSPPVMKVGQQGQPYSYTVTATGGVAPYHWSATGLPDGLAIRQIVSSIGTTSADVVGTPGQDGPFSVGVKVTDSSGQESDEDLELEVLGPYMTVPDPVLDDAIKGLTYRGTIGTRGGRLPLHFSVVSNSDMPPGLSVEASGKVTGSPTKPGQYSFIVSITDSSYYPQKVLPTIYITVALPCPNRAGQAVIAPIKMCVNSP